ncbi:MAG: acyl-CoA ligase (AMP-forming), exosortase A system-associated [Pseudomonadota bacterium]
MHPIALHDLLKFQSEHRPEALALLGADGAGLDYGSLAAHVERLARGLLALGLAPGERVATWLPKRVDAVTALFAISAAGGALTPINPLLKPAQSGHILADSGARVLITQRVRLESLREILSLLHNLRWVILVDESQGQAQSEATDNAAPFPVHILSAREVESMGEAARALPALTEQDLAALLYTSGSTGQPKGVALTHRNLLAGAASVADYLDIRPEDRVLAALPFSFDYGLSQLTVAFQRGASVLPLDYLLPRDLHKAVTLHGISVLAGVPTLWQQLATQDWLGELCSLRVLTNSGGRMPRPVIARLRAALPQARLYLMYGLTEAFRSTWLPPEELDRRPDSIGKAIPNAEVMVLRPDGTPCAPHEPGELVHRGPTVALGYWNDPERTAERYRSIPHRMDGRPHPELAVWSGDRVRMDEEGFIYFIGRDDDMLKTSGYRISPTEIEDVLYASGMVREAAAVGLEDEALGQRIIAVVTPEHADLDTQALLNHCRVNMPLYMTPHRIELRTTLPLTPNGKIDRRALRDELTAAASSSLEPV